MIDYADYLDSESKCSRRRASEAFVGKERSGKWLFLHEILMDVEERTCFSPSSSCQEQRGGQDVSHGCNKNCISCCL